MQKKWTLLVLIAVFLVSFTKKEVKNGFYEDGKKMFQIEYENEMMSGQCILWYHNGNKKTEGQFFSNQKVGKWVLYDSLGKVRLIREFLNNRQFKVLEAYDIHGNKLNVETISLTGYSKDSMGLYFLNEIEEKNVDWAHRVYRTVKNDQNNSLLFNGNPIFGDLDKRYNNTEGFELFSDENLSKKCDLQKVNEILKDKKFHFTEYHIMEDWIFLKKEGILDVRIIGISPVVTNALTDEKVELFWVYYPQVRQLCCGNVLENSKNKMLPCFDDIFILRHFSSEIYKQENIFNHSIADYKKGAEISKEALLLEVKLIDNECFSWLNRLNN